MNPIAVLQELFQQFPGRENKNFNPFEIGKILKAKLGLTQAIFFYRDKEGLINPAIKTSIPKSVYKTLNQGSDQNLKPWYCPKKVSSAWLGFWPVKSGIGWGTCYGLGRKRNGEALSAEEKKLMELLVDRTSLELETQRLWESLERSDRLASVGFMSASMVHEIRNPLTALGTLVQLLPRKKNNPEFMESFQKLMLREIDRLNCLTETYLNFSKFNVEKAEWVDLHQLIGQKIQLLAPLFASKNVQLKSDNPPGLRLKGDGTQIESLVVNLLQNALQSVGPRGKVAISSSFIPRKKDKGPFAEIKVRDNGPGITKENLDKIFDPFYSTKADGTGLGLAICRKIVENHNGLLTAASPANGGTHFRIMLPATLKT